MFLKVICAWCQVVLREGAASAPISHGLCAACAARLEQEVA